MKSTTTKVAAATLLILPLIIVRIESERDARRDRRHDELVKLYECEPPGNCVADFDRDGSPAKFEVQGLLGDWTMIVREGEIEVLRLPYDHTDGTFRTHIAIKRDSNADRLIVYDKASRRQHTVAVFGWDGRSMSQVVASPLENEILVAMAANDDTGGWNERVLVRPALRAAGVFFYYLILIPILVVTFYKIRRASTGTTQE